MIRRAGFEPEDEEDDHRSGKKNTAANEGKLEASISRTRSRIFELALCNEWEWFVTLTLNPEYHNRNDLDSYKKQLSIWIKNYNRLHETTVKYLLIPEQHADGQSWHMHGLLMGLPVEHLREFTEHEKLPIKILIEMKRGHKVYNWMAYAKTFGYITITEIRSLENIASYITKYITKDLAKTKISLNDHLYYCSKGLRRAEKIFEGRLQKDFDEDYCNEYVKIKTVKDLDTAISYFIAEQDETPPTGTEET